MYDRAPRNLHLAIGCTPDHVGPGTYDHRRNKFHEVGYAPFLTLANRGDVFSNDDNPGPGHYDVGNAQTSTIKVRFLFVNFLLH
ncbi:unnamed protein product [Rotaria sp. Silwood1]|nr:unnamed protein product [Rotaria sp. Silwood1]CAF1624850.1 unnamed protein product [Rotaria sp. Silwood1]CAF3736005.1 unnamed protein product [Rotaria sp. Silwood1]CAF3762126.1 unnamed protein product [Rotaria sp. Silwood1]